MAKKTLLDIVQQILSDSDGDDVNSIIDTVESDQCARVVRDTFDFTVDTKDLQHMKTLKQLIATDASTPNVMIRPEGFHSLESVRYDHRIEASFPPAFQRITYETPDSFVDRVMQRSTDATEVDAITLSNGAVIPVRNDKSPTYYTVFDEGSEELVFDSYDSNLDSHLQTSKSLAYGTQKPTLPLSDSATMDLPRHLEQLIITDARAMYFDLYKDGVTSEIDRRRRRAEVRSQRQRNIIKNTDNNTGPNFGRK